MTGSGNESEQKGPDFVRPSRLVHDLEEAPQTKSDPDKGELDKLPIKELSRVADSADENLPYSPSGKSRRKTARQLLGKNRAMLFGSLGFLGGGGLIAMLLMGLLPMKLEALISNMSEAAAKVPGYAVEQRTEYLVTRALATRMLMLANNASDIDGRLVFCGNRSITCSLFSTYTADFFSKEMDFDMTKRSNGKVTLTVSANGRQYLGGPATSWDIETSRDWKNEGSLKSTIKEISSHQEMRSYLKNRVEKGLGNKNTIMRYVARRILMQKYGVRSWRAFEGTRERVDNKIADIKTTFQVGIYKNTIGKISPRVATYLACLQGAGRTCEELLDKLMVDLTPPSENDYKQYKEGTPEYNAAKEKYEKDLEAYKTMSNLAAKIKGEIPEFPTSEGMSGAFEKLISSKLLALAGTVVGVVMITDIVMTAINSVGNGVLDEIGFDMAAQTYTGFAYGDVTGIVTNYEKIKTGDLTDDDGAAVMNELGSLVDCDGSTLCAYENGYPWGSTSVSAASSTVQRECSTSDGAKLVTLAAGELVCPERKLYRNYAGALTSNPAFQAIKQVAEVWAASIHAIIEAVSHFVGGITEKIFEATGISAIIAAATALVKDAIQPLIDWFMQLVFNPPLVGYGATSANNYDAVSGAAHLEQWELMKNGIDAEGNVLGGGGQYLTEEESQAIIAYQDSENAEYFKSQSLFARMFDAGLKGSMVQRIAVQSSQTPVGIAKLTSRALASLLSLPGASAATKPQVTSSAFALPNYSYKLNDPVLTANPDSFTPEACSASAAAREASKGKADGVPVLVYKKSDPCALEKLVVGSLITRASPSDPYAFKPITNIGQTTNAGSGQCPAGSTVAKDITQGYWDGSYHDATFCAIDNTVDRSLSGLRDSDVFTKNNDILQTNTTGKIVVIDTAAQDIVNLVNKYGKTLEATFSYRSHNLQCIMYYYDHNLTKLPDACSAIPIERANQMKREMSGNYKMSGDFYTSSHESGKAIDIVDLSWINKCAMYNYDGEGSGYCFKYVSAAIPDDDNHIVWKGK